MGDEMPGQKGNILAPLPQRRQLQGEDVQAIVEIGAKAAGGDGLFEIAIGGGDHPHVDLQGARAPHPLQLAFLKGAQQAGLR